MAMQELYFSGASVLRRRAFCQPHIGNMRGAFPSVVSDGSQAFSATNPRQAIVFAAPAGGSLASVLFRVTNITVAGTYDLRVRIEGVTAATGVPDGNVLASCPALAEAATTGAAILHFSPQATLVAGQFYALVFEQLGSAEFFLAVYGGTNSAVCGEPSKANTPVWCTYTGAAWSRVVTGTTATIPFYWLRIGGVWNNCGFIYPLKSTPESATIPVGTEAGLGIIPVHDMALAGVRLWIDKGTSTGTAGFGYIRVYDSDGVTVLRTAAVEENAIANTNGGISNFFWDVVRLAKGRQYYIGVTGPSVWALGKVACGNETEPLGNLRQGIFGHDVWWTSRGAVGAGAWAALDTGNSSVPFVGFHNAGNYQ